MAPHAPRARRAPRRAAAVAVCFGPLAGLAPMGVAGQSPAVAAFQQLWRMVIDQGLSRGVPQAPVAPVSHLCQFGATDATLDIARFVLMNVDAPVTLELLDLDTTEAASAAAALQADFGAHRVQVPAARTLGLAAWTPGSPQCDLVLYSEAAPRFSVDRLRSRLGDYVVVVWVSGACVAEQGDKASPTCNFLNTMWEKTVLMRRGYCTNDVCMSRVPSDLLQDPNVLDLDCDRFLTEHGNSTTSEFNQDWFVYWNFLRDRSDSGVYVDVGAALPFEYSNTVAFDRCMGWKGVCVEPNPHLVTFLQGYRSCEVFPNCVDAETANGKAFVDNEGALEFKADCLALGDILTRAGLRGRRIDVLSVDVEHGELRVLNGLPLHEFDIRTIVVEVSRGAQWLEVDTAILPFGYAKVAILGRDAVYVKLEELRGRADWPFLANGTAILPDTWKAFHQRVVDEENEAEMVREKEAFMKGLRRR